MIWGFGITIYYIWACDPPEYYWEKMWAVVEVKPPHPVSGSCRESAPWEVTLPFVFSLISDIGILTLPMATLKALQIPRKKKLGLVVIFGFGIV